MGSCPAPARLGSAWLRPSLARLGPALLGSTRLQPTTLVRAGQARPCSAPARPRSARLGLAQLGFQSPPRKQKSRKYCKFLIKTDKKQPTPEKKSSEELPHAFLQGQARLGSARPSSVWLCSALPSLAWLGPARPGSVRLGPASLGLRSARLGRLRLARLARLRAKRSSARLGPAPAPDRPGWIVVVVSD